MRVNLAIGSHGLMLTMIPNLRRRDWRTDAVVPALSQASPSRAIEASAAISGAARFSTGA